MNDNHYAYSVLRQSLQVPADKPRVLTRMIAPFSERCPASVAEVLACSTTPSRDP
jgi:hypothetical protein